MTPEMRDDFEQELGQLQRRFDPARWRGEPTELITSFDDVGKYYEGDVSKKIRRGAEAYLDDRDARSVQEERATRAIIATDDQRERRLQDLNNDAGWKREREAIQNQHNHDYEVVWRQVERVREEAARANGIDVEKTREAMQRDAHAEARARAGREQDRAPHDLAVWDAAERRNARIEEAERSQSSLDAAQEPKLKRNFGRGF